MDGLERLDAAAEAMSKLDGMENASAQLNAGIAATRRATEWLITNGATDPAAALGGSSPYLRMLGTVVCGGLMAKLAVGAAARIESSGDSDGHLEAKIVSARFFNEQILPTATGLESAVTAGAGDLFALSPSQLL
jgi:acyl-CoA dehydrogenase